MTNDYPFKFDIPFHTIERAPYVKRYDIDISYLVYDTQVYNFLRTLLTKRQQQVVELRYFKGLTIEDIAELCGVTKSTISRTLKRARERMIRARRIKEIL